MTFQRCLEPARQQRLTRRRARTQDDASSQQLTRASAFTTALSRVLRALLAHPNAPALSEWLRAAAAAVEARLLAGSDTVTHPGGNPGANLKSISHRCYLLKVAFVWELTEETIVLPLGCLQGGD